MEIVHDKSQLKNFVLEAFKAADNNPILIDKFLDHAMEVDVDALSDGKEVLCGRYYAAYRRSRNSFR